MTASSETSVWVVVPAYNPGSMVLDVVQGLVQEKLPVVVVDDGSEHEHTNYFKALKAMPDVTVLQHDSNQGKGQAIKTAIAYLIEKQQPDAVVTVDADGQHQINDVMKVIKAFVRSGQVVLGQRDFSHKDVPFRSRFGNQVMAKLFAWTTKHKLQDTQTGLRVLPATVLPSLLTIKSNRYQFEFDMLLLLLRQGISLLEVPIATVYLNHNASSHFNPIIDSLKIIYVLLRFVIVAFLSFVADFSLFSLFYFVSNELALSLLLARVLSSLFNFTLNRHVSFRSQGDLSITLIRYYLLCVLVWCLSYGSIKALGVLGISVYAAKLISDSLLFFLSFIIQRHLVFPNRR